MSQLNVGKRNDPAHPSTFWSQLTSAEEEKKLAIRMIEIYVTAFAGKPDN